MTAIVTRVYIVTIKDQTVSSVHSDLKLDPVQVVPTFLSVVRETNCRLAGGLLTGIKSQ